MADDSERDRNFPEGWRHNPSAWSRRLPVAGLAVVGLGIATYLSLYQMHVVRSVWEPFFGEGSRYILRESWIAQVLPVPDALLGALGYLMDLVTGLIGGKSRWRTLPWAALVYGGLVCCLGLVSILLVVAQPVLSGSFCTLCLVSAVISLLMVYPAAQEMLASWRHLKRQQRQGKSFWQALRGLHYMEMGSTSNG